MTWNQHKVDNIKWSVFWRKKGKWVRKRFREDLGAALKFMETRDYPNMTLHSDNMAFPPPKRITEHERETWQVVTRRGKKYKKKTITIVNLMKEYNEKGVWWCPYCIKLRRFELAQTERGPEMYCPVCAASHRIVKEHNPKAIVIEQHKRQERTPRVKPRRRKRRGK